MTYERWLSLMQSLCFGANENTYHALVAAYSEKHRYYHTVDHINAVLSHLDTVTSDAAEEIELALWFHDAIYRPLSATNERDSAHWAADFLQTNGCDEAKAQRIIQLIMATSHNADVKTENEKLIVDIDLSILGCSDKHYQQFESNVRKEYRWVPLFIYRKKRKTILMHFMNRERIYNHTYFYEKFERQARNNLEKAVSAM